MVLTVANESFYHIRFPLNDLLKWSKKIKPNMNVWTEFMEFEFKSSSVEVRQIYGRKR